MTTILSFHIPQKRKLTNFSYFPQTYFRVSFQDLKLNGASNVTA